MIKMYKELKSTRKVGNFFGISKVTVSKILKQIGCLQWVKTLMK